MHSAIPSSAHDLRDTARVVAVGLVRHRTHRGFRLAGLDADGRDPRFRKLLAQPGRQRTCLKPNPPHGQPEYDAPTPCGTGEQSLECSDLSTILFGHGGFNVAKRITWGAENHGLYVFSATQPVSERLQCDHSSLIQSVRRNRVHEVNFVICDLHLQLANPDFERRYRIATALLCFRCLSYLPTEVIQFFVVLRDDPFGVIQRTLQLRRMLPCVTEFLRALPLLISQCLDLSGSHARRGQERVVRRGSRGFRSCGFSYQPRKSG